MGDDCKDCIGCIAKELIAEFQECGHDDVKWLDLMDALASTGLTLRRSDEVTTYYLMHGITRGID